MLRIFRQKVDDRLAVVVAKPLQVLCFVAQVCQSARSVVRGLLVSSALTTRVDLRFAREQRD